MVQIRVSPTQFCCTVRGSHSAGASIAQWQSVGLVNQRSWVQSSLEACFLNKSVTVGLWEKDFDPDVIRTRSLLIWSQTRYRCATESLCTLCKVFWREKEHPFNKIRNFWKKKVKVLPRFELGSLDSKSRVLTITPWDLAWKHRLSLLNFTWQFKVSLKFEWDNFTTWSCW